MDKGKQFESMFHRSLCCVPGVSMRIEDGGRYARNRQLGDFLAWDLEGSTYLFECKSTARPSLPLDNFAEHQIADLEHFDTFSEITHAFAVIEFRQIGRYFAVHADLLADFYRNGDRKSITPELALRMGVELSESKDATGKKILEIDYGRLNEELT